MIFTVPRCRQGREHLVIADRPVGPEARIGLDFVFCLECYQWIALDASALEGCGMTLPSRNVKGHSEPGQILTRPISHLFKR